MFNGYGYDGFEVRREHARSAGVEQYFRMVALDFDDGLIAGTFDAVMANQSVHHVVDLERIYAGILDRLVQDSCVLVSDMIGCHGRMRWPEARALVDQVWS